MGFADHLTLQCERVLKEIDAKCYNIAWQLFTTTVYRTPVLKGVLINNWYPEANSSFSSSVNLTDTSLSGSGSLSRITSLSGSKAFYKKDGVMTMTNSTPWAVNAEYLGWPAPEWSGRVGPYRMVALSLAEVAARNR